MSAIFEEVDDIFIGFLNNPIAFQLLWWGNCGPPWRFWGSTSYLWWGRQVSKKSLRLVFLYIYTHLEPILCAFLILWLWESEPLRPSFYHLRNEIITSAFKGKKKKRQKTKQNKKTTSSCQHCERMFELKSMLQRKDIIYSLLLLLLKSAKQH